MIKIAVTIYGRAGERIFSMKSVPGIGHQLSMQHRLFTVEKVWHNLNDDPKLKYDVRLMVREDK